MSSSSSPSSSVESSVVGRLLSRGGGAPPLKMKLFLLSGAIIVLHFLHRQLRLQDSVYYTIHHSSMVPQETTIFRSLVVESDSIKPSIMILRTRQHSTSYISTTQQSQLKKNFTDLNRFPMIKSAEERRISVTKKYAPFWEQATREAAAEAFDDEIRISQQEGSTSRSGAAAACPKVYVYNLPKSMRDGDRDWKKPDLIGAFGKDAFGGWMGHLRTTYHFNLGRILEYRLQQRLDSSSSNNSNNNDCFTDDPNQADLFYVPLLPNPKNFRAWTEACEKLVSPEEIQQQLIHLNNNNKTSGGGGTACRHFFVVSKTHVVAEKCLGWFHEPIPAFQNMQRIATTHETFDKDPLNVSSFVDRGDTAEKYPNLISTFMPTSLHWTAAASSSRSSSDDVQEQHNNNNNTVSSSPSSSLLAPPWTNHTHRDIFMSYIGRSYHGDVALRSKVEQDCHSYNDTSMCTALEPLHAKPPKAHQFITGYKQRSVFCLEPVGDDPQRKSVPDSLSFGCIPVLFNNLSDHQAPWLWGHFRKRSRVLIDRRAFLDGDIDLYELLRSIPQSLLTTMQETISRYGRNIQYSMDDDPNDGIRLLLQGLKRKAEQMEAEGKC